jgi:hypothetical protein
MKYPPLAMAEEKKMIRPRRKLFGLHVDDKYAAHKVFGIVIAAWCLFWLMVWLFVNKEQRGVFGDMFGAVNALFSGLAFAGIIYTILLQREELEAQRHELELTRGELELTRGEFERQNDTLSRQRFETTFFGMLNFHFTILGAMELKGHKGIVAIAQMNEMFKQLLDNRKLLEYNISNGNYVAMMESYQTFINGVLQLVSPYFQSLIALHRIIQQYSPDKELRKRYYKILKSYITLTERIFLFYHIMLSDNSALNWSIREFEKDVEFLDELPMSHLHHGSHTHLVRDPNKPKGMRI